MTVFSFGVFVCSLLLRKNSYMGTSVPKSEIKELHIYFSENK